MNYFAQIKVEGISASSLKAYKDQAKKRGLSVFHLKIAKSNFYDEAHYKGCISIGLYGKSKEDLKKFIEENPIVDCFFFKKGQVCDIDYTIPKGNLKIKAGGHLELFERVANIKLTKGFIQLLDPLPILEKGKKVDQISSKILQILNKKLRIRKSEVVLFGSLKKDKKQIFSEQYVSLLYNPEIKEKIVNNFISLIESHDKSQYVSISTKTPLKLGRLLKSLNKTLNG